MLCVCVCAHACERVLVWAVHCSGQLLYVAAPPSFSVWIVRRHVACRLLCYTTSSRGRHAHLHVLDLLQRHGSGSATDRAPTLRVSRAGISVLPRVCTVRIVFLRALHFMLYHTASAMVRVSDQQRLGRIPQRLVREVHERCQRGSTKQRSWSGPALGMRRPVDS